MRDFVYLPKFKYWKRLVFAFGYRLMICVFVCMCVCVCVCLAKSCPDFYMKIHNVLYISEIHFFIQEDSIDH